MKVGIFAMFLILSGCSKTSVYSECVDRGVAYYKEIGSYPMLKSENISAEEKSEGICTNNPSDQFRPLF